ncbi:MAG: hypothetical protein L0Y39_09875 [Methylococcaceae bacterium]|nr:hypothetical protein [Methylococcaceae bacterium]
MRPSNTQRCRPHGSACTGLDTDHPGTSGGASGLDRTTPLRQPEGPGIGKRHLRCLEGRLMAILEAGTDLTLAWLNQISQAWLEQEFSLILNTEIGLCPLRRCLDSPTVGRDCPDRATLRQDHLLPFGSRIRARVSLETASRDELLAGLKHLQIQAGNTSLITPQLIKTLCGPGLGNSRVVTTMSSKLLAAAAQQDLPQLVEKLFLNLFAATPSTPSKRVASSLTIQ